MNQIIPTVSSSASGSNPTDITDLEWKTQHISIDSTTDSKTQLTSDVELSNIDTTILPCFTSTQDSTVSYSSLISSQYLTTLGFTFTVSETITINKLYIPSEYWPSGRIYRQIHLFVDGIKTQDFLIFNNDVYNGDYKIDVSLICLPNIEYTFLAEVESTDLIGSTSTPITASDSTVITTLFSIINPEQHLEYNDPPFTSNTDESIIPFVNFTYSRGQKYDFYCDKVYSNDGLYLGDKWRIYTSLSSTNVAILKLDHLTDGIVDNTITLANPTANTLGQPSTGSSANVEIWSMVGKNESDYLSSGLNGSFAGVQNVLHNGKYITCTASIAMTAGRVVSFTGVNNNTSELSVTYCNGNVGEQNASSLALGVTMNDVQIGGEVQVAVEGICSVLIGSTSTAQRGCMVTVGGSANSYQGRVTTTSRYGDEPSIGICLSYGSRNANQPIVVKLQGSFESY